MEVEEFGSIMEVIYVDYKLCRLQTVWGLEWSLGEP